METTGPIVDCLQQLTWTAAATPYLFVKVMAFCLVGFPGLPWRSSQSCPPNELLTEFTTSPHVAVKGFSLCSFVWAT